MKKKVIIAVAIFGILAVGVAAALIYNGAQEETGVKGEVEVSAQLPQLTVCYGEKTVGILDGYTMEMDSTLLRDVIVPVAPDRQATMKIDNKGNKVASISYEVSAVEDGRLIDAVEVKDFTEKDGVIQFVYKASTIMEFRKEYNIKIVLETDAFSQINYYARTMVLEEEFVAEQVEFAKKFSDQTFDDETANKLALYLETDNKMTHDNLGKINIKTNYSTLVWGTIDPEKITDTNIAIKEICIKDSGQAATYTMDYQIKAKNGEDVEEKYNVAETITVWTCAGKLYVLAYDREVNQIWEATANNVGNGFIDLGIQNQTEIEFEESENGQYLSYAINGDIYLLDTDNKKITQLYKLKEQNGDVLNKTKARVINVDDKGNTDYMIYGYSPAEEHIGKNGISVMSYDIENNISTEIAFIPSKKPVEMLDQEMSELCHIGDGTLYIMMNSTVYYANLNTKEWGTLIENMEEGSYAINQNGNILAYNTTGTISGSTTITVVNLTTGEKKTIEDGGQNITVCGYTGSNLIYGVANEDDSSYEFFPMYKLVILDEDLNKIKDYQQKNVLITDVEIAEGIINIKRWKKGKNISDDQLLDNTEVESPIAKSSYYLDDVKQKELAISFTYNLDSSIELEIKGEVENRFVKDSEIAAELIESETKKYYVYGYGSYQGIYTDKKEAINKAREVYGLIVDETGVKIWTLEENYE